MPGTASVMVSFFGKPMPSAAADAAALAEEAELELELEPVVEEMVEEAE